MKFDYLRLAEIIKKAREDKGLSLRDLGYKVGTSHAELSRFENGLKPNLSYIIFIKICNELDLNLYKLLYEVGLYDYKKSRKYQVFIMNND